MHRQSSYRRLLAYNIVAILLLGSCASDKAGQLPETSPVAPGITVPPPTPPPPPPPPPVPAYPTVPPDQLPDDFYVQPIDPDYAEYSSEYAQGYESERPRRPRRRIWSGFNQVANDGEGAEGAANVGEADDPVGPCYIGDRPYGRRLKSVCDSYNKQWNDLAQGRYKLDAPTSMYLGDKVAIRLSIAAKPASEPGSEGTVTRTEDGRQIIEEDIRIGGEMFAYLEPDTGAFKINPEGKVFLDTDADVTPAWSWEITALKAGSHRIRARIGYKLTGPDGDNELLIPADDKEIEVLTTFGQKWSGFWAEADNFIKTPTGAIGSLTALLAALFGLWTAFKKFRAKKEGASAAS